MGIVRRPDSRFETCAVAVLAPLMVAVLVVAAPPPALAAVPTLTLSEHGGRPDVAVDDHVQGGEHRHIVWNDGRDRDHVITHYCRIPSGANRCDLTRQFDVGRGRDYSEGPRVLVWGGTVVVLMHRTGTFTTPDGTKGSVLFAAKSTSAGTTFDAPRMVGTQEPSGDAILVWGRYLYVVSDTETGGTYLQATTTDSFTSERVNLATSSGMAYDGTLGWLEPAEDDGWTVVVAFSDLESVYVRVWQESSGDVHDSASWSAIRRVDGGKSPELSQHWVQTNTGAPVQLLYERHVSGKPPRLAVRSFDGASLSSPVVIGEANTTGGDLAVDLNRGLHVTWNSFDHGQRYRSSFDGRHWTPTTTIGDRALDGRTAVAGLGSGILGSGGGKVGNAVVVDAKPGSLSNGDDRIVRLRDVSAAPCAVAYQGSGGHDVLRGDTSGDTLFGLDGDDTLEGRGRHDCIFAGSGNDTALGGPGDDRLLGAGGADVLVGGGGSDTLVGGDGNDDIRARDGAADTVRCGPGRDVARIDARDVVIGCERTIRG